MAGTLHLNPGEAIRLKLASGEQLTHFAYKKAHSDVAWECVELLLSSSFDDDA